MSKETYKLNVMKFLKQDDWLNAGKLVARLNEHYPLDREIFDTTHLIFGVLLERHLDFKPQCSGEYMWRAILGHPSRTIFDTLADFNKAVKLNSNNHYALRCKAIYLDSLEISNLKSNIKTDLIKATEIYPMARYFDDLAGIYTREEEYETALFYQLRAVELASMDTLFPEKDGVYCYKAGLLYLELRKPSMAKIMFAKTLEYHPTHEMALQYMDSNPM
jgi:tetratricopeptide (TPR) repeat protein